MLFVGFENMTAGNSMVIDTHIIQKYSNFALLWIKYQSIILIGEYLVLKDYKYFSKTINVSI